MLSTLPTMDVVAKAGGTVGAWSSVSELDLEKKLAVQLVHLASQFQASDYACAKFGAGGSTLTYVPLSINLPDHFQQLQQRQASYASTEAWWLCDPESQKADFNIAPHEPVLKPHSSHPVVFTRASPNLQHELSFAIDTPLISSAWLSREFPLPKTSDTHPISVSAIIPEELLSSISLHISLADSSSPTVFNIHPAFSLHRLASLPDPVLTPPSVVPTPPVPSILPVTKPPLPRAAAPSRTHLQIWSRVSMKSALQSALATNIHQPAQPLAPAPKDTAAPRLPPLAIGNIDLIGEIFSTSHFELDVDRLQALARNRGMSALVLCNWSFDAWSNYQNKRSYPISPLSSFQGTVGQSKLAQLRSSIVSRRAFANDSSQRPCPALGNLYLSSCPGKKVRLTGPVRGRGAICRDLKQDLRRIKTLGIGCIVCCLDDEELELLGASWPDYSQSARQLGLDILRIPIPEGLAPASLSLFDAHLTRLISDYTLAGVHVLAHCRGGVGRAGLVACCWMLKLGLCGWVSASDNAGSVDEGQVRRDTLEQVERAIGIVRRRRSLKAIETYEQVKFLVGYVDYLGGNKSP
ncbi:protein-tyrosine phosphatase-like protein [Russula aff. rugulosa BPL654]|nr:protein-tyrosine phosphatase-like protein [Russula aff. rugulosa BPL654]